jgi:hypothetical protein
MKIILEASAVKRELVGPFNMCASKVDVERLRNQLNNILADWDAAGCCYGWATIYPSPVGPGPCTVPLPWTER